MRDELDIISENILISPNNINKSSKETLLSSGIILKNVAGIMYFSHDPLSLKSIELCIKMLYLISPCFTEVLKKVYKENKFIETIIKKKFKRFLVFFDIETDLGGDIIFQIKLLRYLIHEEVLPCFRNINKKKVITYLDDLVELRNSISHQVYKKDDYKIKQITKGDKRSQYYQKNKLRNYNFIKKSIDKSIFILKEIFNIQQILVVT